MSVNNFDVLKTMAERELKIKSFPLSNVTNARIGKEHGSITIMVDNQTVSNFMAGTPMVFALIVADADEFADVKSELDRKDALKGGEE